MSELKKRQVIESQNKSSEEDRILKELIEEHGKGSIIKMEIENEHSKKVAYFLNPKNAPQKYFLYSRFSEFYVKDKFVEAGATLVNQLFLKGDNDFKNPDSDFYLSACHELRNYMDFLPKAASKIH